MARVGRKYTLTVEALWARDRWTCWLCGLPVPPMQAFDKGFLIECGWWAPGERLRGSPFKAQPTRDHVVPVHRGGRGDNGNIRLAHRVCNTDRHSVHDEETRTVVLRLLRDETPRRWQEQNVTDFAVASKGGE